ncbi:MAG: hypothetical protein Q9170_007232 [Blastenia crenularia]
MVTKGGVALRGVTTFLRSVEFLGSALVLGITSYWLGDSSTSPLTQTSVLTHRNAHLPTWMKAVEGMAGGAVIYTGFAVILTCFLGGFTFFAFLAVLLDILFVGAFVAIAILTRGGARSCSGSNPPSVLGPGNRTSCKLETAVFAVAIAMALLFLISAALQVLLSRQHKKEKRYGPGPSNNYTSGSGKKQPFWKRKRGSKNTRDAEEMGTFGANGVPASNGTPHATKKQPFWKRNKKATHDAELGAAGTGALIAEEKHRHNNNNARTSHETGVTGTTAGSPGTTTYGGAVSKYNNEPSVPHGHHANGGAELAAPTNAYQPYREGVTNGQSHTQVVHDPSPYAEVHHGGYPHAAAPTEYPSTFGHGNYQAS